MEKHTPRILTVSERAGMLGIKEGQILEMDLQAFEEKIRKLICLVDLLSDPSSRELLPYIEAIDADTRHLSNTESMETHWAYQEIVARGESVVPVLIKALDYSPHVSFHALGAITQENPIEEEHRGFVLEMIEDWRTWAEQKGVDRATDQR